MGKLRHLLTQSAGKKMWAVIDIGSNTIRLVIYTLEEGNPHSMLNKKYAVGLAGYLDENNQIQQEGINVLLDVLADCKAILQYVKPEAVFPFGTASLRNSNNGTQVAKLIQEKFDWDVHILSGEEEATFDYYGALQDGVGQSGLLVDVGGGSTELTFFENQEIVTATSIPIGSLNLYKAYVTGLIPTQAEAHQMKKTVNHYLRHIQLPEQELTTEPIYSVGGTARAALKLMQARYSLGDDNTFQRTQLKELFHTIALDRREFMHSVLQIAPDRAHTLVPGLLIFQSIAKHYHSTSFVTVRYGVREGYLLHCLEKGDLIHA